MTDVIKTPESVAGVMETYARHLKESLTPEQSAILDAILLAEEIKNKRITVARPLAARLRGNALKHRNTSVYLSACMEELANLIDDKPNIKQRGDTNI